MSSPRFRPVRSFQAILTVVLFSTPALAQSNEFKIDSQGRWVQTAAPEPGSDEALIADARRALAEDRPGHAKNLLDAWVEEHEREANPYLAEALQLRGDATTALGDEYQALYDYERVIKEFHASPSFIVAVERELDIGIRYINGLHRKFLGMRVMKADDIGQELLIRVQERMPRSRLGERAGIELADYYYRTHNLTLASEAYDLFLQNYPNSQYHMKAMQRRVYSTIARFKGPEYDRSPLLDSQVLVKRFAALYPAQASQAGLDDALVARLDESAAAQRLASARWYLRQGDEVSTRYALNRLIREHPRTAAAAKALDLMMERGWVKPPPPVPEPEPEAPSAAADAPVAPAEAAP